MKIYVNNLPQSCRTCELNTKNKPLANYPEIECLKCNLMKKQDKRHENCPLQTLSNIKGENYE